MNFANQSSRTVTIRYGRNEMTIVFRGILPTHGITSPLANTDIQPQETCFRRASV
jgi:hypothetical protein